MPFIHWIVAILLAATTAMAVAADPAPRVAFTFDDGPTLAETPRLTPAQRNQALLAALAAHGVQAALFVTSGYGADQPEGRALARAWGEAGHAVGNHTVTHPDLNAADVTLTQYQRELLACDAVIAPLPGYRKWFRFTYLREGNTPEKRDGMRAFLATHTYRNAYVSLDTSDWRLDALLRNRLARDPQADVEPIRLAYLAHVAQRAQAYRALAQRLLGRDAPQVLLLHHNLINALWLNDVIAQFKSQGWQIVSPETAFADPLYAMQPERATPGQSLLLSIARTRGEARIEGWERLVDDGDFEIDALKARGIE
ncbi:MAG: polysaccharide deacetylase family protein [Proteobacteria bacterium]|nr:polysaccharide deacetylase family protein [Pseudomonadota bacterium]